jgi:hypothetical protein
VGVGQVYLRKIDHIEMETNEKSPTWKAAWVVPHWASWSEHCSEDVARLVGSGWRAGVEG